MDIKKILRNIFPNKPEEFFEGADTAIKFYYRSKTLNLPSQREKLLKILALKANLLEYKPSKQYIKRQKHIKICPSCGTQFSGTERKIFCKPSCSPSSKRANRERKRLKNRGRSFPKWQNKQEISEFYKNCPIGYVVDHIIPLKGKNISGLHVLSNLQYLTVKENSLKSNTWDGTNENNGWRKLLASDAL